MFRVLLYRVDYDNRFLGQLSFGSEAERDAFWLALSMNEKYAISKFSDTDPFLVAFKYPEQRKEIMCFDYAAVWEHWDEASEAWNGEFLKSGYEKMNVEETGDLEVAVP